MSLHRRLIPLAVLLLAGLHSGHGFAAERPLWELGAGIGVLSLPDYRGSDQSSLYAIPFPYLVYRGEFLKADRHGIRDTLFGSDRIELNFSLGALQPVNSDDNRACQGMSDLQPVAELGPSLNLNLWRTPDLRTRLDLRLPIRSAVAVKGGMNEIGWVFSPRLNRDIADVAGLPGWKRAATPAASS